MQFTGQSDAQHAAATERLRRRKAFRVSPPSSLDSISAGTTSSATSARRATQGSGSGVSGSNARIFTRAMPANLPPQPPMGPSDPLRDCDRARRELQARVRELEEALRQCLANNAELEARIRDMETLIQLKEALIDAKQAIIDQDAELQELHEESENLMAVITETRERATRYEAERDALLQ